MDGKRVDRKKKSKNVKEPSADGGRDHGGTAAQKSEYRDLRKRVDARKDAKQILKIAKRIESEA